MKYELGGEGLLLLILFIITPIKLIFIVGEGKKYWAWKIFMVATFGVTIPFLNLKVRPVFPTYLGSTQF